MKPRTNSGVFLVYGAGTSGLAATQLLLRHRHKVLLIDDQPEEKLSQDVRELTHRRLKKVFGTVPPSELLPKIAEIVVSPGVDLEHPFLQKAAERKLPVISELELAYRFCRCPVIAVTGTDGKSTTTALIAHILKTAGLNAVATGNIGFPFSAALMKPGAHRFNSVMVVEVSSYQLEGIREFRPHVATLLNIAADHLKRHKTFQNYCTLKYRITTNQTSADFVVLNYDDPYCRSLAEVTNAQVFWFSLKGEHLPGAYCKQGTLRFHVNGVDEFAFPRRQSPLVGEHNTQNLLAAMLASLAFKVSPSTLEKAAQRFSGLEHRLEPLHSNLKTPFEIYNDSKSTNAHALFAALKSFPGQQIVLMAGGQDKGLDYSTLIPLVRKQCKAVVLFGEACETLHSQWSCLSSVCLEPDFKRAISEAVALTKPGEVLLFSPGCPSFDLFENFEERGRAFQSMLKEVLADA